MLPSSEENLERLEEEADKWFDQRINCGGYALEIDTCVFNNCHDFEKAVVLLYPATLISLLVSLSHLFLEVIRVSVFNSFQTSRSSPLGIACSQAPSTK